MKHLFAAAMILAFASLTLSAQKIVGGKSREEKKNLEVATLEFKDMLQYGHLELADKVMAPDYIQHNPNVPGGREGFKQFMSRNRTAEPIQKEWKRTPTLIIVAGPYVMFMTDVKAKDPADPAKEYTRDHFDLVRVAKGMIAEHWDEARKNPPVSAQNKQ